MNHNNNGLSSNNNFNQLKTLTTITSTTTGSTSSTGSKSSTTYQHVSHKKQLGTLILNESGYTFYPISNNKNNGNNGTTNQGPVKQSWPQVSKHQVSPVTHARHLLKLVVVRQNNNAVVTVAAVATAAASKDKAMAVMFEFQTREEVERIRKDVSHRLFTIRKIHALNNNETQTTTTASNVHSSSSSSLLPPPSRKRNHTDMNQQNSGTQNKSVKDDEFETSTSKHASSSSSSSSSYSKLTKSQYQVASSSLLASYPTLRTQHSFLLQPPPSSSSSLSSKSPQTNVNTTTTTTTQQQQQQQLPPPPHNDQPIILNENDFWSTHSIDQSNQLSKIIGVTSCGLPSTIKSSLDIQITTTANTSNSKDSSSSHVPHPNSAIRLGVEEMKQIFIMYPAVHAVYEEKVPLELSEELFWRKYLESEYFHRDRGKLGMSAKAALREKAGMGSIGRKGDNDDDDDENDENTNTNAGGGGNSSGGKDEHDAGDKKEEQKKVDENIRVAVATSNDFFSKKEMELKQLRAQKESRRQTVARNSLSNKYIAIGQFDLTSTANTERGSKLLLNSNGDAYPSNDSGKKVIEKYNKHWAMVLNPNDAVAGCDLSSLARKSVTMTLDGDDDANVLGGVDDEMQRLVNSVTSHKLSNIRHDGNKIGDDNLYYGDNVLFEELELKNVTAYSGQMASEHTDTKQNSAKQLDLDIAYSNVAMEQAKALVKPILEPSKLLQKIDGSFPDRKFGKLLLEALTKKLVEDSKTEKDAAKMTNQLPEEFRKNFTKYFRRSTELLRHFFALRRLLEIEQKEKEKGGSGNHNDKKIQQSTEKLERIVTGLVDVYREMEGMRNSLSSSDIDELKRKMFNPVMDQLDWATKLHKDGKLINSNGPKKTGGFGFVEVTY